MIQSYKHSKCSYVDVPNDPIYSPDLIETCLKKVQIATKIWIVHKGHLIKLNLSI